MTQLSIIYSMDGCQQKMRRYSVLPIHSEVIAWPYDCCGMLKFISIQVYDAARRAAIHDTVMNFPDKYDTVVGERGLKVRQCFVMCKIWKCCNFLFL